MRYKTAQRLLPDRKPCPEDPSHRPMWLCVGRYFCWDCTPKDRNHGRWHR